MQLSIAIIFRERIGWPRHKRFYIRRLAFVGVAGIVWPIVGVIVVRLILGSVLFEAIFRIFRRYSHQAGFLSHHHWSA